MPRAPVTKLEPPPAARELHVGHGRHRGPMLPCTHAHLPRMEPTPASANRRGRSHDRIPRPRPSDCNLEAATRLGTRAESSCSLLPRSPTPFSRAQTTPRTLGRGAQRTLVMRSGCSSLSDSVKSCHPPPPPPPPRPPPLPPPLPNRSHTLTRPSPKAVHRQCRRGA